ncbi:hypothetical protein EUGRSUZ_C01411 [Eucalyptus grandis]|uniref:Uncharacterized protein n=2 Tax=Eucalyptus grandis TaxID=71139 RepID=A0ACC3LCR2_EUCGR|nr:hypothetical protein EUGRSUZ_C01411 [Eucalyptus grandis]
MEDRNRSSSQSVNRGASLMMLQNETTFPIKVISCNQNKIYALIDIFSNVIGPCNKIKVRPLGHHQHGGTSC